MFGKKPLVWRFIYHWDGLVFLVFLFSPGLLTSLFNWPPLSLISFCGVVTRVVNDSRTSDSVSNFDSTRADSDSDSDDSVFHTKSMIPIPIPVASNSDSDSNSSVAQKFQIQFQCFVNSMIPIPMNLIPTLFPVTLTMIPIQSLGFPIVCS